VKLKIIFVTAAANITDNEHYDGKGNGNQKSAFRVYVVPIIMRNKRARKMTFLCRKMGLT